MCSAKVRELPRVTLKSRTLDEKVRRGEDSQTRARSQAFGERSSRNPEEFESVRPYRWRFESPRMKCWLLW